MSYGHPDYGWVKNPVHMPIVARGGEEDRTAKVAGDALVGLRALEPVGQEAVVEALAARGETVDLSHACLVLN
jgi:hypothetical protein